MHAQPHNTVMKINASNEPIRHPLTTGK
jgi:hypothetical protein